MHHITHANQVCDKVYKRGVNGRSVYFEAGGGHFHCCLSELIEQVGGVNPGISWQEAGGAAVGTVDGGTVSYQEGTM